MSWFAKVVTRELVPESFARKWSEYACYVAAMALLALGYHKISRMAMTEVELYMSVMLTLLVASAVIIAGSVIGLKEAIKASTAKQD